MRLPGDDFLHGLVGVFVFNADGDGMFAGGGIESQFVIESWAIGEACDGGGDLPFGSIERVLAFAEVVEGVGGVPLDGEPVGGTCGGEAGDLGRSVVDGEGRALRRAR